MIMKLISWVLLASLIGAISCNKPMKEESVRWTENQKRSYFEDSIAFRYCYGVTDEFVNGRSILNGSPLNHFSIFMDSLYPDLDAVNKYDPYLYAFEEDYFERENKKKNLDKIRIICDRTFGFVRCVTLYKTGNRTYLTSKITNGQGGYNTGVLVFSLTQTFSDSLFDVYFARIKEAGFWTMEHECWDEIGCDGDTWNFEVIHNGDYKKIVRWHPAGRPNTATGLMYQIGAELMGKGKINEEDIPNLGIDSMLFKHKMLPEWM